MGEVRFTTPLVRPIGIAGASVIAIVGLSSMTQSEAGGAPPVSQFIVGAFALVVGIFIVVAVAKGYALTVTEDAVVARGIRNRVIPLENIRAVAITRKLVRLYQMGYCLSFTFSDGSQYAYKNFNAGLSQSGKGYDRLVKAKELIERRIAELGDGDTPPPPHPGPPVGPADRGYDDPAL